MQRDHLISELQDDLARVRAELAATNSRLAWLEGYVEGRDRHWTPEFEEAVREGVAASRRGDVVPHEVILADSRARRSAIPTAA